MFHHLGDEDDIPREPKKVPHHDDSPITPPIIWLLVSILGVCAIFLLYRRASQLITIAQPLKNLIRPSEGRIRLSEDGPPAESFTHDDEEEDEEAPRQEH